MSAAAIESELSALADPARAEATARFFKTGPGDYGEGDIFLGISVPEQRKVARRNSAASLADCEQLLASKVHEHRLVALFVMRLRFESGDAAERSATAESYLRHRDRVNNWDLVDASARYLLAERAADEPGLLDSLVDSSSVWDRRIAILTTFAWICEGEAGETLRLSERLLGDEHDLIHKAVGWMLREVGKRVDVELLRSFLADHVAEMPRTTLRYAIERLPAEERKRWMEA